MSNLLPFAGNPLHSRADVQRLLCDLVKPILPHFSPNHAQVRLGENRGLFGDPADWLEGFARPLWGLVPLGAGGARFDHWNLWLDGIASGTDPTNAEYWGLPGDFDQRSVEQAAFGFALALAPGLFWDPLPPGTQKNLAAWLRHINEVSLVPSNWLFFRVLVNLGLRRCAQSCSMERVKQDFAVIDSFYLGDGWYEDGANSAPWRDGRLGDYYIPMAYHFYGLLYARLASADDPARAKMLIDRARRFAQDFLHWFSADGAALPFGRSLTYRFAQGAFWGALAFAGIEALPWTVIKGLYLRHLRWWMRQPIFSETGLLTIGYAYPNLLMAESYNSSQSPYWALKAFLPLSLPEEHPFWQAEEAPLPLRRSVHTVPGAKLIIVVDPRTHDVTAINPGQPTLDWPRNAPHKYSKCAYSTRFGFSVPASVATPEEGGLDHGLSLSDDKHFFRVRGQALDPVVQDGVAYSRWQPWPDVEVRSWLIAEPTGHVRIHLVNSARKIWALDAGFAVAWTRRADLRTESGAIPAARTPACASALRDLLGERHGYTVDLGANSHLLAALSTMPVLHSEHEPGEHWLTCWAGGSADFFDKFADAEDFTVTRDTATGCRLLRKGQPWWSLEGGICGTSSPARLQLGQTPA
jgi:hypothetical protein